jgi:hypothetical protein
MAFFPEEAIAREAAEPAARLKKLRLVQERSIAFLPYPLPAPKRSQYVNK